MAPAAWSGLLLLLVVGKTCAAAPWVRQEQDVPAHDASTSSWVKGGKAPANQAMQLTVALRVAPQRLKDLERVLFDVSDPDHERYGQHLSIDQVTELVAVPRDHAAKVRAHFLAAGATSAVVAPNNDMIAVTMPVSAAEAALRTVIHVFTHRERPEVGILRAASHYFLPHDIDELVSVVGELLQFPRLLPIRLGNAEGVGSWPNACESASGCNGLVTPAVLAQRYKLPTQEARDSAGGGNGMAVAEFQGQYFIQSDLDEFSQACHTDVKVANVVGGNLNKSGMESELDIEYIRAVAPSVPLTVIYSNQFSLLDWVNLISSTADTPHVHSLSYGNDERQQSGIDYMMSCNTGFMKAGARGISLLVASGDQGVCGREGCGLFSVRFKPDFPGGSPYVTVVGGTNFVGSGIGDEEAWSSSGGGFSDTFDIPDYQQAAVAGYKSSSDAQLPDQSWWNNTGRGYPDVSALGGQKNPYCVTVGGRFEGIAGTSASCPVVAGVFALLNGLRLSANGSPLGFLNPFIYKNPSGFQDVLSGRNGAGRPKCGFNAVKGWDPATGMGTPDYEALAKLTMRGLAVPAAAVVV